MYFQTLFDPQLSIRTFLIGDESTKQCVVIDPTRHIYSLIALAQNEGYEITDILETHVHADFISGSKELKNELNNKPLIWASKLGGDSFFPAYADKEVFNHTKVSIGNLVFEAIHTPGHTPEHICWLCFDQTRSKTVPWLMFTGDCLFVDSVGRPDLIGKEMAWNLGSQLYDSIFITLNGYPDFVEIYPSHSAGSICGKYLNSRACSTLGYERLYNHYLKKCPRNEWIQNLLEDQEPVPNCLNFIKRTNIQGPALLDSLKTIDWNTSASPKAFNELFLVDIRQPEVFAQSYIKNSLNISLNSSFSKWATWFIPQKIPLGVICENEYQSKQTVDYLHMLGFDQDIYIILFDPENKNIKSSVSTFPILDVEQNSSALMNPNSYYLLDVRTQSEWDAEHVEGSNHLELNKLESNLKLLPSNQSIAVICRSGARASLAASLLRKEGFSNVCNIKGGINAWKSAGLPLEYVSV